MFNSFFEALMFFVYHLQMGFTKIFKNKFHLFEEVCVAKFVLQEKILIKIQNTINFVDR